MVTSSSSDGDVRLGRRGRRRRERETKKLSSAQEKRCEIKEPDEQSSVIGARPKIGGIKKEY